MAAGPNAANMPETEYTEDAKQIAGVSFDKLVQQGSPDAPPGLGGPTESYVGIADGKLLGFAGIDDAIAETFVNAAKAGDAPLSKLAGVEEVAGQLPEERVLVAYIAIDEFATFAGNLAQQFGAPIQVNMPPDLPPVGCAVTTDDGALVIKTYVPTSTVRAIVAQGMQAYMQMMMQEDNGGM